MFVGQKYVNKKEIINKLITRIEKGINDIEKDIKQETSYVYDHLRLEGNDKVRGMDFLLFEDVLNPEDDKSFEVEIELLSEEIAKECGNSYNFKKRKISYIKLIHNE